jgi:hypothetical protein
MELSAQVIDAFDRETERAFVNEREIPSNQKSSFSRAEGSTFMVLNR